MRVDPVRIAALDGGNAGCANGRELNGGVLPLMPPGESAHALAGSGGS